MYFDDFDDEFEQCDDGEAFDNTLVHLGQGLIGQEKGKKKGQEKGQEKGGKKKGTGPVAFSLCYGACPLFLPPFSSKLMNKPRAVLRAALLNESAAPPEDAP